MRWSDEAKATGNAHFPDVTRAKPVDLSWARRAEQAPETTQVVSLRPPRVPRIDGLEHAEGISLREESRRRDDAEPEAASAPPPAVHAIAEPPHGEIERRRPDTMIDEIVPRAEEEVVTALREAVARAAAEHHRIAAESEDRLVELALLVARRVIAREVSMDPGVVRDLVREGIVALGEQDRLVVRVGRFFAEKRDAIAAELAGGKTRCDVIVDPSLGETGCVVETELGSVDESIEARLANLIEGLSFGRRRGGR